MADLNELLTSFTRVRGVVAAVLVGHDGLPLQSVVAPGVDEADVDVLGAIAASGPRPGSGDRSAHRAGRIKQAIYEFDRGVVVIEPMGSAILVVVTDAVASLGFLRLQARKAHPELQAILADL